MCVRPCPCVWGGERLNKLKLILLDERWLTFWSLPVERGVGEFGQKDVKNREAQKKSRGKGKIINERVYQYVLSHS